MPESHQAKRPVNNTLATPMFASALTGANGVKGKQACMKYQRSVG